MVVKLEEALDEKDISDLSKVRQETVHEEIADTVKHITALFKDGSVAVEVYDSLRNQLYILQQEELDNKLSEEEKAKREEILKEVMELRRKEIDENRHYIHVDDKHYDVGLLIAAAHWRMTRGDKFYEEMEGKYKGFEVAGSERAVVIETVDKDNKAHHHIITKEEDLVLEEVLSQLKPMKELEKKLPETEPLFKQMGELSLSFRGVLHKAYTENGYHILRTKD